MAMRRGLVSVGRALVALLVGLAPLLSAGSASAAPAVPTFPGNSRSHYLTTVASDVLRHTAAKDAADARRVGLVAALVVLDLGSPARPDGSVILPDTHRRVGVADVRRAVVAYGAEWVAAHGPPLVLVVGTTNYGRAVTARHGAAWGRLASAIAADLPGVDVRGGIDAETEWNRPAATLAWERGYLGAGRRGIVDFGNCTCPPLSPPPHGWTVEARWAVATAGGRGAVLPEVYATAGGNAAEWAELVRWSREHHPTRPVRLIGILTEVAACTGPPRRACAGIDATPLVAWRQLAARLGGGAGDLRYATDIGYLRHPGGVSGPLAPVGGPAGASGIGIGVLLLGVGVAAVFGRRLHLRRSEGAARRRTGSRSQRRPARRHAP